MKKGRTKLSDRIKGALLTVSLAAVLTAALTPEEQPKQQREPEQD